MIHPTDTVIRQILLDDARFSQEIGQQSVYVSLFPSSQLASNHRDKHTLKLATKEGSSKV